MSSKNIKKAAIRRMINAINGHESSQCLAARIFKATTHPHYSDEFRLRGDRGIPLRV
ncbi:MAG: hypothetical protein AB7L09_15625 [Nitrospira sp.]